MSLAFGGTTPFTRQLTDLFLLISFGAWLVLLIAQRRLPRFPLFCLIPLFCLVLLGTIHWLNPKSVFYEKFWVFNPLDSHINWLPGTFDKKATGEVIWHLGALLLGFLVLIDACKDGRARWLLLAGLALSGFAVALVGIYQKASGTEFMLWMDEVYPKKLFFGAFRYHANAASFLNLCWPAAFALFMRYRDLGKSGVGFSLWLIVFLITVSGVFVNTSKAGHALGCFGLVLALLRFRSSIFTMIGSRVANVVSVLICVGLVGVLVLPALSLSWERWVDLFEHDYYRVRFHGYGICLPAVADSGLTGFGPGTFSLVFPFYRDGTDEVFARIFWTHAHQDYLQTIIEWGYAGMAAWLFFYAGALWRGFSAMRFAARHDRMEYSVSCALIAISILCLHAAMDFPFQIPAIQLPAALYLAILWTAGRPKKSRLPVARTKRALT
ncbi:MAG: O-antigen ligase family protein [Verrucomicrobiota bacterium]